MKRFTLPAVLLLSLPLAVGCADRGDRPDVPTAPLLSGKPNSGSGETDYPSTFSLQTSISSSAIFGDAVGSTGGITEYLNGNCGIKAVVYASGDGYLQTNNPKLKDTKCPDYPRKVGAVYQNGNDFGGVVMNANNIRGITAETGPQLRQLSVRIDGSSCDRLHFSADRGATSALVTRVDPKTWRVESTTNAESKTTAVCEKDLSIRVVGSFSFTIRANI